MLNKLKSSLVILGFVSIIGFSSCTDDDTTTGPDNSAPSISKAFVTTTGSYWIYQNQETDSTGKIDSSIPTTFDSTIVKSNYSLDGKNASEFLTYTSEALGVPSMVEPSTAIYAKEGEKVYINSANFLGDFSEGLPIGDISGVEKWLTIMQDASSWDILTFPIVVDDLSDFPLLPVEDLPVKIQLRGDFTVSGKKLGNEEITINGTKYQAAKYQTITSINAKVQLGEDYLFVFKKDSDVVTITIPTETNIWIVNGIGIVKTETKPFSTKVTIVPTFKTILEGLGVTDSETKNGGSISNIVRYNVK